MIVKASLQRPFNHPKNTHHKARFSFAQKILLVLITFWYQLVACMQWNRKKICQTKTIPGTISYHQFLYLTEDKLSRKMVSEQKKFSAAFKFCKVVENNNVLGSKVLGSVWLLWPLCNLQIPLHASNFHRFTDSL